MGTVEAQEVRLGGNLRGQVEQHGALARRVPHLAARAGKAPTVEEKPGIALGAATSANSCCHGLCLTVLPKAAKGIPGAHHEHSVSPKVLAPRLGHSVARSGHQRPITRAIQPRIIWNLAAFFAASGGASITVIALATAAFLSVNPLLLHGAVPPYMRRELSPSLRKRSAIHDPGLLNAFSRINPNATWH